MRTLLRKALDTDRIIHPHRRTSGRRKKLLVLLGAGSSISCGMPTVAELDKQMTSWATAWSDVHQWPNYFVALWKAVERYYAAGKLSLRPTVNFEKAIGEMVALSHWVTPAPWGDTLREITCQSAMPPYLHFPFAADYGPTITIRDQLSHLLIKLATYMRGLSGSLDRTARSIAQYGTLLRKLREVFDVGIYNLNYDTVALTAWPDAYVGFDSTGAFDAGAVNRRTTWGFIYHLHGSVHHSLKGPLDDRIEWRPDLTSEFFDGHQGLSADTRSDGRSFPKTTLVAGGFKLDQLLVEPFHSLHASLVRHLYQADAVLIGGYGFADSHVNRALRNRLATCATQHRPPVLVLDRGNDDTDPMAFRHDLWANEVCRTLHVSGWCFRKPGHDSPPDVAELALKKGYEVVPGHRVALWYGGFVEAVSRVDAIVSWLDGSDDKTLAAPAS